LEELRKKKEERKRKHVKARGYQGRWSRQQRQSGSFLCPWLLCLKWTSRSFCYLIW